MMLQESVEKLAMERLVMAARSQRVKEIHAELSATPKGQEMIDAYLLLDETRERVKALESCLRAEAVAEWERTSNKKPAPGIGIRKMTGLEYDEHGALMWCMAKHTGALRVNKREFEKAARVLKPDFVTFTETHTATIARDLPGALAKARKEAG